MSNEVSKPVASVTDLMNTQVNEENPKFETGATEWIPILAVCYATSDSFKEGIAKPGEFVLSKETSLSDKISAVCLDFRAHAALVDKDDFSFKGECYVGSEYKESIKTHEKYSAFIEQDVPANHEIQEGYDLFLFIPSVNAFCTIFCKKTLASSAEPIYKASKGGRLVEITTVMKSNKTGKRSWYTLNPVPLKRALVGSQLPDVTADIAIDQATFVRFYEMFKNPKTGPEVVSKEESGPSRAR